MSRENPQSGRFPTNIAQKIQQMQPPPSVPTDPLRLQRLLNQVTREVLDLISQRAALIQGVQRLQAENDKLRADLESERTKVDELIMKVADFEESHVAKAVDIPASDMEGAKGGVEFPHAEEEEGDAVDN